MSNYPDEYDPDIHGEITADPPARGMAIAVSLAGCAILIALGLLAQSLL